MNYLYLLVIVLTMSGQNFCKKPYTQKNGEKGVYIFNAIMCASAMLFFVITSKRLTFNTAVLPYAIGFAVSYAVVSIFVVKAIAFGSLSLTSLFVSYSLMLPTLYGLVVQRNPVSICFIPGIVLLALSLFFINKKSDDTKVSLKWLICVILAFLGNGANSIFLNVEQLALDGAYKNEFMIIALALDAVVMLVMSLFAERKDIRHCAKTGWYWAAAAGLLNSVVNLFVMILSGKMQASLMFPLISAGGLIVTYLVSKFVYKEELTKTQFVGFVLGLAAVVFLNI